MSKPCYRCKKRPRHNPTYCIECWREIQRNWRNNNRERRRELDRLSKRRSRERDGSEETRRKWNEWYDKNKEHRCAYQNEQRNKEKEKVYKIVGKALEDGVLIKPDRCSECGEIGPVDAHHEDYSKPLEVTWLCRKCHSRLHNLKDLVYYGGGLLPWEDRCARSGTCHPLRLTGTDRSLYELSPLCD